MKYILLVVAFCGFIRISSAQTQKILNLNITNPGIGFELPLSTKNSLEFNTGLGINYSYRSVDADDNNLINFLVTPHADLQLKRFYNFDKRSKAGKSTEFNSGNFFAIKAFYDGRKIGGNMDPEVRQMIAFGPAWGLKRSNGKFSFRGSVGPIVYGDFEGNVDFYPLNFTINFSYLLRKKNIKDVDN